MKKLLLALLLLPLVVCAAFPVARNGKALCVLVHPDQWEAWRGIHDGKEPVVHELKQYLEAMTGATFAVYPESQVPPDVPAIYCGNTKAARTAGIEVTKMANRAWHIKISDRQMFLTGGSLTGSMYALYILLEKHCGVLYLSPEAERIPAHRELTLPTGDWQGKPFFASNSMYHSYFQASTGAAGKHLVSLYELKNRSAERRQDMGYDRKINYRAGSCHSFFRYVPPAKYFKEHPEYYSMNREGKRAYLPQGQLCLSNPQVKEIALRQLKAWIAEDKKANPDNYALVYDCSQEDNTNTICLCPECRKVTERHGGEAGLILEFINYLARGIAQEHPDIMIRTFAYVSTEKPVDTIRPEKNVIVWLCDLYSQSNRQKPLTDPENAPRLKLIRDWMARCDQVSLWDYWNMGAGNQPEVLIDPIAADTKLFQKMGLKYFFAESEIGGKRCNYRPPSFIWLQYYVGYKLQEDPQARLEDVVTQFMDAYYGDAAPPMKTYLANLRKGIRDNPPTITMAHIGYLPYVTTPFLIESRNLCRKAMQLTPNKDIQQRIQNELAVIDFALIKALVKKSNPQLELRDVIQEYNLCMQSYIKSSKLIANDKQRDKMRRILADEIASFTLKFDDIPSQYASYPPQDLKYLAHPHFPYGYRDAKRVRDPKSTMPLSLAYLPLDQTKHKLPWPMGIYDQGTRKTLAKPLSQVPQDENYHWIQIGQYKIGSQTSIWAPGSWHMSIKLSDFFIVSDGVPEAENPNVYDVWVSIRFQGPAYVKGSPHPNAVYIDRALLARRQKNQN